MWFDPKSYGCLVFIIAMLGLIVAGIIGLVNFVYTATPILIPRITANVPYIQERMFSESTDQYPVLVEAPREIRAGSDFTLSVRGAEYHSFSKPLTITFTFSTDDLHFVRSINPVILHTIASGNSWLLAPQEINVSTINIQSPPDKFSINVFETTITKQGQTIEHPPELITISVDNTPIPSIQIAQAIKSLLAFLLGTFGVFIASKLFK